MKWKLLVKIIIYLLLSMKTLKKIPKILEKYLKVKNVTDQEFVFVSIYYNQFSILSSYFLRATLSIFIRWCCTVYKSNWDIKSLNYPLQNQAIEYWKNTKIATFTHIFPPVYRRGAAGFPTFPWLPYRVIFFGFSGRMSMCVTFAADV